MREVAPRLLGRRVRGLKSWHDAGFAILLGARRGADIVVSLSPAAPGLFAGRAPANSDDSPSHSRLKKLLSGAELVGMEPSPLDRVVTLRWQRSRPSGTSRTMELVLEWPGTRTAALLIDVASREVLDVTSPGTPRTVAGETFQPLPLPPAARELATSGEELRARFEEARREGETEPRALRTATGLSPMLVDDLRAHMTGFGIGLEEAFHRVAAKLEDPPHPVLLRPADLPFHGKGYRLMVSPIELAPRKDWVSQPFPNCNAAAEAFVQESNRASAARELYGEALGKLRKASKRTRKLYQRLHGELEAARDPEELRRWGEILLAGLRQAKRAGDAVLVPDPYQDGAPLVRLPIDPRWDLSGNAQRYFARARKAIRTRERLEKRLAKTKEELDHLETLELAFEDLIHVEALDPLVDELRDSGLLVETSRSAERKTKAPRQAGGYRLEPRRFPLPSGAVALAGRSARSNEELTFRVAQPEDVWFHAAATAGAHVVLRVPSGTEASGDDIEASASVAAFFSKARSSTSAEVLYTLRKNVRKIPGAPPGTVRVARFQTMRVKPALPPAAQQDVPE